MRCISDRLSKPETRQQARETLDKMQAEGLLRLEGRGRGSKYYKNAF